MAEVDLLKISAASSTRGFGDDPRRTQSNVMSVVPREPTLTMAAMPKHHVESLAVMLSR